jgi:cobalt-zinc-cadmium efflux system membrane fusion protein
MYATVTIQTEGRTALAIPRSALLHLGAQTVSFVALPKRADGMLRFAQRSVSADEDVAGDMVPVVSGLSPGENVVSSGGLLLTGQ